MVIISDLYSSDLVCIVVILYFDLHVVFFFFFKQKTAYEIGTGDWSSDVCSSDLLEIVDVTNQPYLAEHFKLVATPALIKVSSDDHQDRKSVV